MGWDSENVLWDPPVLRDKGVWCGGIAQGSGEAGGTHKDTTPEVQQEDEEA